MISKFFIHHPIFASVISILLFAVGVVSIIALPVEQYPNITPPMIQVSAQYNGANAATMANDVASPLEQQLLGVEDMIYMYSHNSSTGTMTLDLFFEIGSDPNMDQVNVQNLVNQANPLLPNEVQKEGVTITKQTPNILLVVAVQSPNGKYNQEFVSNYANINVVSELDLLPGISNVSILGEREYSMRIWLRPDLMAQYELSAGEVIRAIQEQNMDFGIGQLGQAPNIKPVPLTIPMSTKGRLSTPEEFQNIIVKADLDGATVRVKDIANVTLGAQDYTVSGAVNNKPTILLAIYQEYGANALQVAKAVEDKMKKLSLNFPEGIDYAISYDSTKFIRSSISEVVKTLLIAAFLVIGVVFLFLQHLRLTLLPILAMIISIVGTFTGMYLLGFSINTLTLFGMVLAVGIVVDDAIVVTENVERNLQSSLMTPKEAAIKAMEEVTAPVIAIVFVLVAVFLPVAFLGGIAGQLYKQFAITISISVFISGFVALSLTPALAALLIRPKEKESRFEKWFSLLLQKIVDFYLIIVRFLLSHVKIALSLFLLLLLSLFLLFSNSPISFVPQEDQGYLMGIANLPDGASLSRTQAVNEKITRIALSHPGVEEVVAFSGFSIIDSIDRTSVGSNFIVLKDWSKRKKKALHAEAILQDLQRGFSEIEDAKVMVINPPTIQGLGTVGGLEFWLENRGEGGEKALEEAVKALQRGAAKRDELATLHSTVEFHNLQFYVDLDRSKTKALGIPISEVFQTLQTLLGSVYVNNFNKYGRIYQVIVQAQPQYRERLENIGEIYVKSSHDKMVPLKSILTIKPTKGSNLISRFNDFPAVQIFGSAAPGYTTGEAIKALQEIAKENLPPNISFGFSGEAYQEIQTGGSSPIMLLGAMFAVFLILAALYENWGLPLAIILAVPFGAFGAFVAIRLLQMPNDIYFQIGLITLVALSAKNAILIVEFARKKREEGLSSMEAALDAAKLRFRAILMTSLTFILGVCPLVFSSGAGAASRHSVGVGVLGGMIAATLFTICFVPLFFSLLSRKKR